MLLLLLSYLHFPFLNVIKYLTFRSGAAVATALLFSFCLGRPTINYLKKLQVAGQPIREDGPESHLITKAGIPTMGGILIIISIIIATLLWGDLKNPYIWITLFVLSACGLLGFMDDYLKIKHRNSKGVSGKLKLLIQLVISIIAITCVAYASSPGLQYTVAVPFFKNVLIDLSWFYFIFGFCVIAGASNAVNLTDGLDGLVIFPVMLVAGCFTLITYLVGNVKFAHYLQLHYVPHCGELAILCSAIIGAGLGFLWYNAAPAEVFMGDVGSLSLGGALGIMSVITKHEIVLFIVGGLFVIEALSVMIQVISFKYSGKRVFHMAPIHHHFEKLGWPETKIVIRFWILSCIFALIGLATLKLR